MQMLGARGCGHTGRNKPDCLKNSKMGFEAPIEGMRRIIAVGKVREVVMG